MRQCKKQCERKVYSTASMADPHGDGDNGVDAGRPSRGVSFCHVANWPSQRLRMISKDSREIQT